MNGGSGDDGYERGRVKRGRLISSRLDDLGT